MTISGIRVTTHYILRHLSLHEPLEQIYQLLDNFPLVGHFLSHDR